METLPTPKEEPSIESNLLSDFIEYTPSWLLRSGTSTLAITIVTLLSLSAFIKYPDTVASKGIMISATPPIEHFPAKDGILDSLYVKDMSIIRKGDRIGAMLTPGSLEDIVKMEVFIQNFERLWEAGSAINFPENLELGTLQKRYAELKLSFSELIYNRNELVSPHKVRNLSTQLKNINKLIATLSKQREYANKELTLAQTEHARNNVLYSQQVLNKQEIEKSNRQLLSIQKEYVALDNAFIEHEIRRADLQFALLSDSDTRMNLYKNSLLGFKALLSTIKEEIREWEEEHIISAKVSGQVLLSSGIVNKVKVSVSNPIATVLPLAAKSRGYVKVLAPESGIGKMKNGNKVILKIEGYPFREFGSITSNVESISLLPKVDKSLGNMYEVNISLPAKIITNYNKVIPFKPNTGVYAEIITNDVSLFERLFHQFLTLKKNIS